MLTNIILLLTLTALSVYLGVLIGYKVGLRHGSADAIESQKPWAKYGRDVARLARAAVRLIGNEEAEVRAFDILDGVPDGESDQ